MLDKELNKSKENDVKNNNQVISQKTYIPLEEII